MKIIISPAKKMKCHPDDLAPKTTPVFLEETKRLLNWLKGLSYDEAKALWACSDKIAEENYQRIRMMDLAAGLTPAILSYEGIQYQYMAPAVFKEEAMRYIQDHLRILSGFYGVLKPFDGVTPYRLEMQAKGGADGCRTLYEFWGDKIFREVRDENRTILNLASKEYSKCIEAFLDPEDHFITCVFGQLIDGEVKQKGTLAKMARGEMVRFMVERQIEDIKEIRGFDRLGYRFDASRSTEECYVFLKEDEQYDKKK